MFPLAQRPRRSGIRTMSEPPHLEQRRLFFISILLALVKFHRHEKGGGAQQHQGQDQQLPPVGAPQVAYRETIRKEANQETKYARQSGGKGQYGHVKIKIEPNPGKGYEFVNGIVGGAIPKEYIPAVDNGIQGAMKSGILAGYPVVDVKVTLWDGSYHEVDSSEMAFSIAGSMAFKDAMKKADPVIMEPIMKVDVVVPDEYMGNVIGDLNSRRGAIQNQESTDGTARVTAMVPLSEMFGYATDLRSSTQGRGQYTMEPHSYVEIPKSITDKIVEKRNSAD